MSAGATPGFGLRGRSASEENRGLSAERSEFGGTLGGRQA